MSDNSRSRVTVTLGRNGRVVKRTGDASDGGFSNGILGSGRKRSIRDRLGADSDGRSGQYNKRQHRESSDMSSVNDVHLGKHDLRFKLMQKNIGRQSDNNFDLRDKLSSKTSRPSGNSKTMRPPEATVSARKYVPEPGDTGITRQLVLNPHYTGRDTSVLGQTSSRNTSDLPVLDTSRTYSSWSLDNIRRRSPERPVQPAAPRELSSERSSELMQRRTLLRAYDDGRSSSYLNIAPRPVTTSAFLTRSSVSDVPVKPVAPRPSQYSLTSGVMQKIPSMGDGLPTVESLLYSLDLEKYAIYFKAEEIDMNALRQLGDNDLKELGIPMGPRKKILDAVISRSRRHL